MGVCPPGPYPGAYAARLYDFAPLGAWKTWALLVNWRRENRRIQWPRAGTIGMEVLSFPLERQPMPIHDWTRVDAGLFHAFHQDWIGVLARALNAGVLPPDYFALREQSTRGPVPDVLTLELPSERDEPNGTSSGLAVAVAPPRTRVVRRAEDTIYVPQGGSDRRPTPARPSRRRGRDRLAREQGEQE